MALDLIQVVLVLLEAVMVELMDQTQLQIQEAVAVEVLIVDQQEDQEDQE